MTAVAAARQPTRATIAGVDVVRHLAVQLRRRGFVTRSDALEAGIRDSTFDRAVRHLGLTSHHHGLWVPEEADLAFSHAAVAALESIPEPALLTGATALQLLGVTAATSENVEVVVPLRRSPAPRDGVCIHHTVNFDSIRYQHVGDLRVAAAARAVADFAAHATVKQIAVVLAETDRLRIVRPKQVVAEIVARKRFPGRGRLRTVADDMTGEVTHSSYERRARRLLAGANIFPHRRPLTIETAGGLAAEIDLAFPGVLYGVEIDGPHHLLADVAAADRIRDRRLRRAGWEIDRFFWFELEERPTWFVNEVARRLAERRTATTATT